VISLQVERDKISQAVRDNDVTTLKEMITHGVDVNNVSYFVSDIVSCDIVTK